MTGVSNELGEMCLLLTQGVGVQHKIPLLEMVKTSPAHVERMRGAQGVALSIDNVGTQSDRELLPSSAAAQMKKAANVQYLLQDVYHVFNRISETLRNSHKLYSLALWKLRTVRVARAARAPPNPEQTVRMREHERATDERARVCLSCARSPSPCVRTHVPSVLVCTCSPVALVVRRSSSDSTTTMSPRLISGS